MSENDANILLVEDNPGDVRLTQVGQGWWPEIATNLSG